jgi:hypothetical protein
MKEGRQAGRPDGWTDGSVTIYLRNFVGEGIISARWIYQSINQFTVRYICSLYSVLFVFLVCSMCQKKDKRTNNDLQNIHIKLNMHKK